MSPEPAIIVAPDAALLGIDEWAKVANAYLDHCGKLMSRVVILDVLGGQREAGTRTRRLMLFRAQKMAFVLRLPAHQPPMAWRIIPGSIPMFFMHRR